MKIGFTYDLKTDWEFKGDEPRDINAELDKPETVDNVAAALEKAGHEVIRIGHIDNLLKQLDSLDVDIVFNMCEGKTGRNRESQVPVLLEMKDVPFVGADALTLGLTLDKVVAKQVFLGEGIPTAEFFSTDNPDDAETLNTIGYPLIVKTRHEGSSKGITEESKVNNLEELKKRIRFVVENYNQPALVEKFISGQEFTIAVLGNGEEAQAMPVVQTSINGQKDFEDKVYTNRNIYDGSVKYLCPAPVSAELTKTLQNLAVQVFRAVDCRDLARVDFRVDKKGR
ncbi:MAG: ATP-grasp domain-containing protein, partial [Candidatus Omnitrophica bacterium]|nr:ATP-grasp domain-containing protein [Candidatus Omnitrophota bacterium]